MKKTLRDKIISKYDWIVYRLAYGSIKRMCERDVGFAYLFKLWIDEWLSKQKIPESLKRSTDLFFESLRDKAKA